jgi:hypothetical protein
MVPRPAVHTIFVRGTCDPVRAIRYARSGTCDPVCAIRLLRSGMRDPVRAIRLLRSGTRDPAIAIRYVRPLTSELPSYFRPDDDLMALIDLDQYSPSSLTLHKCKLNLEDSQITPH